MSVTMSWRWNEPTSAESQQLLGELEQELVGNIVGNAPSNDQCESGTCESGSREAGSRFIIGWVDQRPVCCGGILPASEGLADHPDAVVGNRVAELDRMFVTSDFRRQGIGRQLLTRLESAARDLSYRELTAEIPTEFPAAIGLFDHAGYQQSPRSAAEQVTHLFTKPLFAPAIGDFVHEFQRHKTLAERAMVQVDDEQFFRSPGSSLNSLAAIVKHLAGNLNSRWRQFRASDGEKQQRNRDSEFVITSGDSRASLMYAWDHGWSALWQTISQLTPQDLDTRTTIRAEEHSVAQTLHRALAHVAYHVGQINYLVRWLHPDADWLTIAPGKSAGHVGTYLQPQQYRKLPITGLVVEDLFLTPHHINTVAGWIYNEFWADKIDGFSQSELAGLLADAVHPETIPISLLAKLDDVPIGTINLIENDDPKRPQLTPWIAALFVRPEFRDQQVGSHLLQAMFDRARAMNISRVYLGSDLPRYYTRWGAAIHEQVTNEFAVMRFDLG